MMAGETGPLAAGAGDERDRQAAGPGGDAAMAGTALPCEPARTEATLPSDSFLVRLDVPFAYEDGIVKGASRVRSTLFAAGTTTIRSALLFTMIDFLSGSVSGRGAGPTLDIRLQVLH